MNGFATRRLAGMLVAGVLAVLLIAPASSSAITKISTKVKLQGVEFDTTSPNPDDWVAILFGKVQSPKARCRGGRRVNIAFGGEVLAHTTSESDGAFAFPFPINYQGFGENVPLFAGDYTLTALRKRFGRPGRRKLCKPDSAVFHVQDVARNITAEQTDAFTFAGGLSSDEPGCVADETVFVFYAQNEQSDFQFTELTATTDESGNWNVNLGPDAPAGFYAFVVFARTLPQETALNGDLTLRQCVDDDAIVEVAPSEAAALGASGAPALDVPRLGQFAR